MATLVVAKIHLFVCLKKQTFVIISHIKEAHCRLRGIFMACMLCVGCVVVTTLTLL